MQKISLIIVSSSKVGSRFPQRSDHLLETIRELGVDVLGIESFNPLLGIIGALKYRKARWMIFSGFRAGSAGLVLSFFGFKWVYDLVEVKYKLCKDNWKGLKRIFIRVVDILECLMIKRASIVFAASESVYRYAKSMRQDILLIPNGYHERLFNPNNYKRDLLRDHYGVNFPLAVYIGKLTLMYAKFLVNAIRAMDVVIKAIPDAEFWIFGDGPSKKDLERIANKNVKLKGYIEHERVPEILTIADVGIHAYDTGSLKLIEWLAMGLPTIAPKGLHIDGVIECEWTPQEISKQLIEIFKKPYRLPKKMPTWRDSAALILKVLDRADKLA